MAPNTTACGVALLDALHHDEGIRRAFVDGAIERRVRANERFVRAGVRPDAVFLVVTGRVEVVLPATAQVVQTLGPGDIVGDMAWLCGDVACADVRATEPSLLLQTPADDLRVLVDRSPHLAAQLYGALAITGANRLRATNERLERLAARLDAPTEPAGTSAALLEGVHAFKQRLMDADHTALRNGGRVSQTDETELRDAFVRLVEAMNRTIGEGSALPPTDCARIGARVQAEIMPILMLSELGDRMYARPRGTADDYHTVDRIHADAPRGTGRLGPLMDRCMLDQPAVRAIQARRPLMADEIRAVIEARGTAPARVTSVACGPAIELVDLFETLGDPSRLEATCIDIDTEALAHVDTRMPAPMRRQTRLVHQNPVQIVLGRCELDVPRQDLIYSVGLVDHFDDDFVVRLLNAIHERLVPGGRCILGSFHPSNPSRALMEHVLHWHVIHRDEDDMRRLFAASAFGRPCERIRFEPTGVNLFAVGERRT